LALTSAQNTVGAGTDTILNFENLYGSNYNDILIGSSIGNYIYGADGSDLIYAGSGSGNDTFDGGNGNDIICYYKSSSGVTVNLSLTTAQNTLGNGTDTILNIENLYGSNFNDILKGTTGINTIRGYDGDDAIFGYGGNDILTGGNGADIFVFNTTLNATSNVDTITDFVAVDDTINLENAVFAKLTTTGTLSASNFVANSTGTAGDSNDYIIYNTTTGALYYDADGSGSGAAVQFAILGTSSHPTITNADFVII
jgi:Ca2+-binding RTX toxin-like protein